MQAQEQNSFIKIISPTIRLICLVLLSISIIIAKSIYLVSLITLFVVFLCLLTDKKVLSYFEYISHFILLIILYDVVYIISFSQYNVLNVVFLIYKEIIILLLIKIFEYNTNFSELHQALFRILPFKKYKNGVFSLDIALSFHFIKCWINSKHSIKKIYNEFNITTQSYFDELHIRFIRTISLFGRFQLKNKQNLYRIKQEKTNFISKLVLIIFLVFFMLCLLKEVIL